MSAVQQLNTNVTLLHAAIGRLIAQDAALKQTIAGLGQGLSAEDQAALDNAVAESNAALADIQAALPAAPAADPAPSETPASTDPAATSDAGTEEGGAATAAS